MLNAEKPTLKIVIKSEWFDQIIAKEKTIEHRYIAILDK